MADLSQLSRLTRRADSVAESASALVRKAMREIRGELANLSEELNLAGSAQDREKVYAQIRRRMALLARRMNTLMEEQNEAAAQGAAKSASTMTGLEVKYSPSRAKAICELVTPAQGENIAAVFTDRMGRALINSLREATVGMLREQAVAGGSMRDMARDLAVRWAKAAKVEDPKFTDSSGRTWDTKTYIQMNVRTNTMRVYNDCLVDDIARETGSDLARISTGGDQDCDCAAWEGCIISISGRTKGLPTYDDARAGGCFHPNCTHTLEYVDETVDAAEIALQKSIPAKADMAGDYDAQDERKYQIDQARYLRDNPGMTKDAARVAVDRDNLAASIQSGLVRDDAREIVARMTDAQVTALCPDGNPPAFEPTKKATKADPHAADEKWNHGKYGGVVHIGRNASAERILAVCKVADAKDEPRPDPINELKSLQECRDYIEKQFGINAVGLTKFALEDLKGIAYATARAHDAGLNRKYCNYISTGQEMFKDNAAKQRFLDARAAARPDEVLGLAFYARKGIRKGYTGTDAEWYGLCQKLRVTGRTVAHCIRFYNPILQQFNGIYFNAKIPTRDKQSATENVRSGWWAPGGDTIQGTMAHELGHALDSSIADLRRGVRLSQSFELIRYVNAHGGKSGIQQGLSRYGSTKDAELIAEAWCEFSCSPHPRTIATDVGNMILSALGKGESNAGTT